MTERRFCVFILSHGRARKIKTLNSLMKGNYSGDWYIVIDNEDTTAQEYIDLYGPERVLIFDKLAISKTFDTADLSQERRTVVYARNACWELARELGYTHFLQLDDDYTTFMFREQVGKKLIGIECRNLDRLFEVMLDFLEESGATSVALAQGGDFIGGINSKRWRTKVLRKAMNTFFCRTADDWRFLGRVNEDVNTYTTLTHRGAVFLTTMYAMVTQGQTQANAGGMTEAYLDSGTYIKSFYTVMMCPSAVSIGLMGETNMRIHHNIRWDRCAPLILPEEYRKPRPQMDGATLQGGVTDAAL